MTETKHTPGPWWQYKGLLADPGVMASDGLNKNYVICTCHGPDREANARLIEAAPNLLEALRPFAEACAHLHPAQPDDGETLDGFKCEDFRKAAAAYAKATGENP